MSIVELGLMMGFVWMAKAAYFDKDAPKTIFWGVLILVTVLAKGFGI